MCGIAGIVRRGAPRPLGSAVRRMIALQRHRGPDGEGFYESSNVALGHCRLAILDTTTGGHQPMTDRERSCWIVFNGEIYNHLDLAGQLRSAGHTFHSRSDTEVLLAAYREWGIGCLSRLRGMFAFAVWDEQERRLFAARDRLGIKPFHYWTDGDGSQLAFASEIKALVEFVPDCRVNVRLAHEFLAWNLLDHDPAETMVADIHRLPAGHWLTWDARRGLHVEQYWHLEVTERLSSSPQERAALTDEFGEQFRQSVALHLQADVPVGSCLSGGLDSSSIVCAVNDDRTAGEHASATPYHTFSACFEEPRLDERGYIDAVTAATHSENHQVFPSAARLADDMERWLWHQEEPVGGFGAYAQYCVARLAREHGIKVLLDGQGADEQLLGYRKFVVAYVRQLLDAGMYSRSLREAAAFASSRLAFAGSPLIDGLRYLNRPASALTGLWPESGPPCAPPGLALAPPLGARIHADITRFSLPVLLRFEDRNSMAFGLESRVPFLDHVLVECIAKLPADLRLRRGWTKSILRDAMASLLPTVVRRRKSKLGYSTPDAAWLRGPLRAWLTETLTQPVHLPDVIDRRGVARLLELYRQHRVSDAGLAVIFRLAIFERWAAMFVSSPSSLLIAEASGQ